MSFVSGIASWIAQSNSTFFIQTAWSLDETIQFMDLLKFLSFSLFFKDSMEQLFEFN